MKRIYIPLPDEAARYALLQHTLQGQPTNLRDADLARVVQSTEGCAAVAVNHVHGTAQLNWVCVR